MDDIAIVKLFTDLSEKVSLQGRATRATMMAEADVTHMNHEKLSKDTSVWRWIQRNPGKAIPAAIILLLLLISGSDRIDVEKMFEKTTGIEIVDE
jgi:hypothetical protein